VAAAERVIEAVEAIDVLDEEGAAEARGRPDDTARDGCGVSAGGPR